MLLDILFYIISSISDVFLVSKYEEKGGHPLDLVLLYGSVAGLIVCIFLLVTIGSGWAALWGIFCLILLVIFGIKVINTFTSQV